MTSKNDSKSNKKFLQPPWQVPQPEHISYGPGLFVMNSLTRKKDRFITMDGSNQVTWYMCGPTVYDASHMGHARTYLSFDIIRRILQDYFEYDVTLIMNITDIDDKIIERSASRKVHHLKLARHFEQEFHRDMQALGVQPPTIVTRVTEYMPEIVQYIANICGKGLAYESNGSVYFDVHAFEALGMHTCKLAPEQIGNSELLAQGEGKLTQAFVSDKKSTRDFALWKKSKENEPQWESPWGLGRPGWHIECSVMASDVLQKLAGADKMDIHSGGIDLKFPHHDNEMAQAEAECGETQWVNYFIHAGHLNIKGLKMSKSLKNFITIQQALEINTSRQIRMLFLMHKYNAQMDYGDNTMQRALDTEKRFVEFYHNVKACLRKHDMKESQKWTAEAIDLQKILSSSMAKVRTALQDDFDTPAVISILNDLVKATNVYMEGEQVNGLVVRNVASFITRMFKIFRLIPNDAIGFASTIGTASIDDQGATSREDMLRPVLDTLMEFRSAVRDLARSKDTAGVLGKCDELRDCKLPPLGIRLEDTAGGPVWKLADPNEMEQKQAKAQRRAEGKVENVKKKALNKPKSC